MSKKRYVRGDRIETIEDVMKERIVYFGFWPAPRSIEVVKSLQYRKIENCMKYPGIYKAVEGFGTSGDRAEVKLKGQINLFEGE